MDAPQPRKRTDDPQFYSMFDNWGNVRWTESTKELGCDLWAYIYSQVKDIYIMCERLNIEPRDVETLITRVAHEQQMMSYARHIDRRNAERKAKEDHAEKT